MFGRAGDTLTIGDFLTAGGVVRVEMNDVCGAIVPNVRKGSRRQEIQFTGLLAATHIRLGNDGNIS